MNRELLPCPFCGEEARFRICDLKGYRGNYEYISRCDNCNIKFKEDDVYQSNIKARQKVIDKWNTRKPIDRIVEQLKALPNREADHYFASSNDVIDREDAIDIVRKGGVE